METIEIFDDGAWCWFQDPRAIVMDEQLVATSITRAGTVRVSTVNLRTGERTIVSLREDFDADDHNVPGLLLRQDGRVTAYYARHGRENLMFHRTTLRPGDGADWSEERFYDAGLTDRFTYANPFQLPAENGRIYNFWRGLDFNPTCAWSDDDGRSWSPGRNHIYFEKGQRPYVKYASNGHDTIHFAFTEAHPHDRGAPTSLYHAFYRGGNLYRSDGALIRPLSEGPVRPEEATCIYNAAGNPLGKAWVWDIALDRSGNPIIVYSSVPDPMDHRYRYARWDAAANQWRGGQIAHAGRRLYDRERFYSGGITLDKDDPAVVYLSSSVNIHDGSATPTGRFELYRGQTPDGGSSWTWQPLTADSNEDNIRPYVPAGHPPGRFVLWMRGDYRSYTDYATRILLASSRQ